MSPQKPVLILGGGINGCAVARELLLNNVPVHLVDTADIATGATAKSSRLIHGGLRYLEYGDIRLVRESLEERERLLRLAPQFVSPLRIAIPVRGRLAGLFSAATRFFGLNNWPGLRAMTGHSSKPPPRGLWAVRLGLWFYDRLVRIPHDSAHRVRLINESDTPQVDPRTYRWLCEYGDAQMLYPERFVVALLHDSQQIAREQGLEFRVWTYHRAQLADGVARIIPVDGNVSPEIAFEPSAIVNATGAWGDRTLQSLEIETPRLLGGTKGSHFLTRHPGLIASLGPGGVYAEAGDGRLVFVLPFVDSVLVGTTDERFSGDPHAAAASNREIQYLIGMVNDLFPSAGLTADDVDLQYSGVRPLPYQPAGGTAAISRGHSVHVSSAGNLPVYSLIGGKLTTCRAFAEEVVDQLLDKFGRPRTADSRERVIPGGEDYPHTEELLQQEWQRLAERFALSRPQIQTLWRLCGRQVETILNSENADDRRCLTNTHITFGFVRWVIRNEWVTCLDDLVERRLMLLSQQHLSAQCLRELADCLVESGLLESTQADAAVNATIERLSKYYGKRVT